MLSPDVEGPVRKMEMARRGWSLARGLRWLVANPVSLEEARRTVVDEVRRQPERFLRSLDLLVWPFPDSPTRRLLSHAGFEPGDVRNLVRDHGLVGALGVLRDQGVYVSYEEYQGKVDACRGSASFSFSPADFFNPVQRADYMATTGGSRSDGTPVELSFAWQRRQGIQRAIQFHMAGVLGAPTAPWLPVFPSAAGFDAVMKVTAGGNRPERWFSQIPTDVRGITPHKQIANRFLPALNALARTGLPAPEHVPTDRPEQVVAWLQDALGRTGRAVMTGYASSITAAARYATSNGIDLTGVVSYPSSEPVTAGKLAAMRASGMRPMPTYAFTPEGTVAIKCDECPDEEYHLWDHELALTTRTRALGDGSEVGALLWTSLADEAPRVMVNVENDDYGRVQHGVACSCPLGELGLQTRVADIRGISKVVAAGITLDGETFDRLVEDALPAALGGGPGDYQFVEDEGPTGTVVSLRVHPRVGDIDEHAALEAVRGVLAGSDGGVLAERVWMPDGVLHVHRAAPAMTKAGKTLPYERLGTAPARTATTTGSTT